MRCFQCAELGAGRLYTVITHKIFIFLSQRRVMRCGVSCCGTGSRTTVHCNNTIKSLYSVSEKGDAVRCFQCAGLLRNWEPDDDPWEEHRHYFPSCSFVQQNSPAVVRGPLPPELVRQISENYDKELVKKFEEYREANGCKSKTKLQVIKS